MGLAQTVTKYLGVEAVPLREGFIRSSRGVRLPVCRRCGALVAYESQQVHSDWHGGPRA